MLPACARARVPSRSSSSTSAPPAARGGRTSSFSSRSRWREKAGAIKEAKDRLARPHAAKEHVDVLLASNMISVGVDIDRLGLMVVAGQPKSTSEYIQASSRVGRQAPGLVVTCFNVRRPRDRSHYERFVAYHESFYRYVEATSLTPFSGPALERGLTGTLVAMTRLGDLAMIAPASAMDIVQHRAYAERCVQALAARGAGQAASRANSTGLHRESRCLTCAGRCGRRARSSRARSRGRGQRRSQGHGADRRGGPERWHIDPRCS
jgi:ATP-dependent helicase YprA (DUF1998 family)